MPYCRLLFCLVLAACAEMPVIDSPAPTSAAPPLAPLDSLLIDGALATAQPVTPGDAALSARAAALRARADALRQQ